jgi:hypothetical protein
MIIHCLVSSLHYYTFEITPSPHTTHCRGKSLQVWTKRMARQLGLLVVVKLASWLPIVGPFVAPFTVYYRLARPQPWSANVANGIYFTLAFFLPRFGNPTRTVFSLLQIIHLLLEFDLALTVWHPITMQSDPFALQGVGILCAGSSIRDPLPCLRVAVRIPFCFNRQTSHVHQWLLFALFLLLALCS